jgi:hypothetical protein
MTNFLQEIESSLPKGLTLPDPFKAMFAWMDKNGCVHGDRFGGRYASLYPFAEDPEGCKLSLISFAPVDQGGAPGWTGNDPAAGARLAPFIRTGGDGSQAAIWLDDQGRQQFVHLGSGSGSTMLCTLTDNPVDFLRLLAIGYRELCWPEQFDVEPEEVIFEELDEDEQYRLPVQFRDWVESTFGVTVPATASEIVRNTADMDAAKSDDPFWIWIKKLQAMEWSRG